MEMTWFDLERLLKKARAAKEKQTGDHYDGVTIDVGVMGPGALNILYCGSDEGMPPLFYVGFKYEDGEMDDQEIGESLKDTVFRYAKSYGVWGDWDESDKKGCDVDEGDIKKLNDIINGQGFLFENLQTMERISENKKLKESADLSDDEIADIMDNSSYSFLGVNNSIIELDEIDGVEGILVKIHNYPAVEVYKDDGTGDGDGVIKHYEGPLTVAVIDDAITQYLNEYCVFDECVSVKEKTKLKEGMFKSAQINFIEFINKLQQFLDTAAPGMGLEVVEQNLGMGGAYIKIEQRDEEGKTPEDGIASWMSSDDVDAYYDKMTDEA